MCTLHTYHPLSNSVAISADQLSTVAVVKHEELFRNSILTNQLVFYDTASFIYSCLSTAVYLQLFIHSYLFTAVYPQLLSTAVYPQPFIHKVVYRQLFIHSCLFIAVYLQRFIHSCLFTAVYPQPFIPNLTMLSPTNITVSVVKAGIIIHLYHILAICSVIHKAASCSVFTRHLGSSIDN